MYKQLDMHVQLVASSLLDFKVASTLKSSHFNLALVSDTLVSHILKGLTSG